MYWIIRQSWTIIQYIQIINQHLVILIMHSSVSTPFCWKNEVLLINVSIHVLCCPCFFTPFRSIGACRIQELLFFPPFPKAPIGCARMRFIAFTPSGLPLLYINKSNRVSQGKTLVQNSSHFLCIANYLPLSMFLDEHCR